MLKIRRITIETIPHHCQRYDTVGDWEIRRLNNASGDPTDEIEININISEMQDQRFNLLIAVHELVEATLCAIRDISQDSVDKWDMEYLGNGEPGEHELAPYHNEHMTAMAVENELRCEVLNTEESRAYDKIVSSMHQDDV